MQSTTKVTPVFVVCDHSCGTTHRYYDDADAQESANTRRAAGCDVSVVQTGIERGTPAPRKSYAYASVILT